MTDDNKTAKQVTGAAWGMLGALGLWAAERIPSDRANAELALVAAFDDLALCFAFVERADFERARRWHRLLEQHVDRAIGHLGVVPGFVTVRADGVRPQGIEGVEVDRGFARASGYRILDQAESRRYILALLAETARAARAHQKTYGADAELVREAGELGFRAFDEKEEQEEEKPE